MFTAAKMKLSTLFLQTEKPPWSDHPITTTISNVVISILNKQPALERLLPHISSHIVASVIQQNPNPQLGFGFFIWASRTKHLRSTFSETIFIPLTWYAQVGIAEKAVEVFSTKKDFDCRSDVFIYNSVLPVMVQKQVLLLAIAVYNQMLKLNCHSNVTTYSILIEGLCKNGERLDEALKLLNSMKERGQCPDVITYNALLNGFCKFGRVDEAYGLLETFEKDAYDLGLHGYSCLIDDAGRVKEALKLFYEMTERNLVPDTYCYNALIKGFCGLGLLDMAQSIRLEISKNGCFPDAYTYTILICGMCRNGLVGEEKQIFKEMEIGEGRNPSLFLRLSQGANQAKSINGAFKLFKDLQLKGLSPDSVTYFLIDGLQRLDREADAFRVFDQMERNGCMPSFTVYKSLMTCLCRKNKISLAFSLWLKYLRNLTGSEEEAIKAVEEHFEKGEVEKAI
nr:pentatricopeptide repeat-containing protein [Quercus suber]